MSASYSYNSLGRPDRHPDSGRSGSHSGGGSQQNLTGTLNRTQVERRGAQFISARSRVDSTDSYLSTGDRSSPGGPSTLKRAAKSQERLNSTSSNSSIRSNLAQQKSNFPSGSGSRGYLGPQPQGGNSPNYSNVQNYSDIPPTTPNNNNNNNNYEKDEKILGSNKRESSYNGSGSFHNAVNRSSDDAKFHEFEKVRLDYLRRGKLYEDTVFLPVDSSLYFSRQPMHNFEWIRAKDIAAMYRRPPRFVVNGIERFDVIQGELGDCWFVAAVACISAPEHRKLLERVLPPGQSFQEGWYSGVFRFNFWQFGQWKQILIDDLLPTRRGQLCFVHSNEPNEFWGALMEKAYAKIYGSYESLKSGIMADSLTDLTGGVTETYTIGGENANLPSNITNILFKALERGSVIGCAINGQGESVLPNGLVAGHAYSVTDLRNIGQGNQTVTLIRVRNPHGDRKEWRGRWSEWSNEWKQIAPHERERIGLILRDDGEFWMDFEDFCDNFDSLDICSLTPDAPVDVQRRWKQVEHHGRWIKGFNAGGRPYLTESHWANPHYLLQLNDTDEDEDNICSVLVQLMQKDRRKIKQKGETFLFIGFSVYQYEKGYSLPLKKEFFDYHRPITSSGNYTNTRQVTKRLSLPPGEYIVVPSTWDVDEAADYYIRFFMEEGNIAEYCDDKPEKTEIPPPTASAEFKEQEENFKNFFYRVSGENMEVNAFELQDAIEEGLKKEPLHRNISVDACRSFVSLMDVDGSGKLSFYEFQFLWHHMRSWKKTFYQFDVNGSGKMNSRELRAAINGVGYKISNQTIANLIFRFADDTHHISLDNFLCLMARLMKSFNIFHQKQKDGAATFSQAQWLDSTLSL